jgi:hypothetical protein
MNMKKLARLSLVIMIACAFFGVAGCSKSGGNIDTSKVQTAFQSAPPVDKAEVQNGISALKASDYAGALSSFKRVLTSANITPEQKSAVQDLIGQVQAKGMDFGKKAMGGTGAMTNEVERGAGKAVKDLKKPFNQ